jgi:hypothetical protein
MPATMGLVLAWSAPSIASVCSNDQAVHNWTVTLTGPSSDFGTNDIQWADNAGFSGATDVTMAAGANPLSTPASVTTLYVRWASDHTSQNSATWSGGACSTPTVPPTQAPTDPSTLPPTNPPTVPPTDAPTVPPTDAPTVPPTAAPTAPPQRVSLTLIKVLCPSYSVVPANQNPTSYDQTGGHGGELDTSYQTVLVNPTTDIPKTCTRADGWQFQLYGAFTGGVLSPTVGSALTTGADGAGSGSVTFVLDASELALGQTDGSPTGLWVAEIEQPGVASFGALRCYTDINNGDNVENIRDLGTSDQHIYCIAYNVVVSQATPPPTEGPTGTPVATPTQCVVGVADAAAVATDTSCPTPFDSFQGETATPGRTTTPPPTSTGGTDSGNNSTPLFALLICLAFGGLGLAAVEMQRRSIGR